MMKLAPHLASGSSAARPPPTAADEAAGGSGGGDGGIRGTAVTVGAWGRKLTDSPVSHTILVSFRACQLLQPAGMWPVYGAASARRTFCSDRTARTAPEKRPNGRKDSGRAGDPPSAGVLARPIDIGVRWS